MHDLPEALPDYRDLRSAASTTEPQRKGVPQLLAAFVFHEHGFRIGAEIVACITLYAVLRATQPWSFLAYPEDSQALLGWFVACFCVAVIDYLFLARPLRIYRRVCDLELKGRYDEALSLLRELSPFDATSTIPCPQSLFHLRRASILAHAARFGEALTELDLGHRAGISMPEYYVLRSEIFRLRKDFHRARRELHSAEQLIGPNPILQLEYALLGFIENRTSKNDSVWGGDLRTTRREFEQVLALPAAPSIHGESTHAVALAFWEATRLWTGEAEEGLEGLNEAIANLQIAAAYLETLRPLVATLLLERSFYLVTHREPNGANSDLEAALRLCSFPNILERSEVVKEEYRWRYPKKLSVTT